MVSFRKTKPANFPRRQIWITKTADDWFWVHLFYRLRVQDGDGTRAMPQRWKCDGARGLAALIRDVLSLDQGDIPKAFE